MAVLMRYTLRLLTLDQLGRASTLICALELERRNDPTLLGQWPFEIGLWVGQSGTPNKLGHKGDGDENSARSRVLAWSGGDNKPIPIDNCPWCGTELGKASLADERPAVARGCSACSPMPITPRSCGSAAATASAASRATAPCRWWPSMRCSINGCRPS